MNKSVYHDIYTNEGSSLLDMSMQQPVLLVFLRHFGCIFCREAMTEIGRKAEAWKRDGVAIVLVHLSDTDTAARYFQEYGIHDIESISDPEAKMYRLFGLQKGKTSQLLGLQTMIRGYEIVRTKKIYPLPYFIGDGFQMPGVFVLRKGHIAESFIHQRASDAPDYDQLINCCHQ